MMIALLSARAVAQPATRPGEFEPRNPDNRPMAVLGRLQDSLQKLGLSNDQKSQIQSIVTETRQKFQDLREKSNGDMTQVRDGARQILSETREQLMGVLTPEQQGKLRDLMQAGRDGRDGADRRAAPDRRAPKVDSPQMRDNDRENEKTPDSKEQSAGNAAPGSASAEPPPSGPASGNPAPDFKLDKLDGRSVELSTFKDRVLVLVFGSYSSPSFRRRAASIQQLSRELGSGASVLIIYTREAHPKDGWQVERNRDDNVMIASPKEQADRIAQAKQARDALKLSVPIAVDDMSDNVAKAYGAGENSAFVIGRDGKILARQNWADAFGLRRAVENAARKSAD